MARYRKVDPRIWNDAKFRELSDNGKLVFFMLLTHPNMTALGAMRGTIAGLAEEIGWTSEAFAEAFREAYEKGMTEHDPKACLIALPRFIKYNQPESPNVVKAWVGARDLLPECELKNRVISRAGEYAKDMSKSFSEAFAKAFVKTMPYQEPEPDPEPKSTTTTSSAPGVKDDNSSPFRMTLSWEPVKPLLHERCRQAGIDLDNLPEGELADVLGEFRSYWEGRSDMLTERQWQHKLMDQIKKKCVDSRTSGGVIRRSARSGKASANGALSTRDQSLSDCLNDTSWDDPPQLS